MYPTDTCGLTVSIGARASISKEHVTSLGPEWLIEWRTHGCTHACTHTRTRVRMRMRACACACVRMCQVLKVWDGDPPNAVLVSSLSGSLAPAPLVARSGVMHLEFHTDGQARRATHPHTRARFAVFFFRFVNGMYTHMSMGHACAYA